jgi:1-carboxybiuret hydrolase subunit AtzG-like
MATKGKPRRSTKKAARRKPATRPKSGNAPPSDPLDGFIDAAARLLALPVEPQWRVAIKANLEVTLRMANYVAEFALPDETEPAPIFAA